MRFLADENVDRPVVEKLRSKDVDVLSVDEEEKGISDREVLEKAVRENRVLITFDRDFSDVSGSHPGIIRVTSVAEYGVIVRMVEDISESFTSSDLEDTVVEASPADYR